MAVLVDEVVVVLLLVLVVAGAAGGGAASGSTGRARCPQGLALVARLQVDGDFVLPEALGRDAARQVLELEGLLLGVLLPGASVVSGRGVRGGGGRRVAPAWPGRQDRVDRAVAHERVVVVVVDKVVLEGGVVLGVVARRAPLLLVPVRRAVLALELDDARLQLRDYLVALADLELQRGELPLESALDALLEQGVRGGG